MGIRKYKYQTIIKVRIELESCNTFWDSEGSSLQGWLELNEKSFRKNMTVDNWEEAPSTMEPSNSNVLEA